MSITRVEFVGFVVIGPNKKTMTHYKPADWPGWTATTEGPHVLFEGQGARVEVPRARCIVYGQAEAVKQEPKGKKL